MKVLSLFSGIGAPEKSLEKIGVNYTLVNYCEIDKYASKAYAAVHGVPESMNLWDVSRIDTDLLDDFDLLTHGSPCQDFSVAGKGAGGENGSGTRSSLLWHSVRIIEAKKPKYILWENVKNVLSKKHRHTFDAYLETLRGLGYNNYFKILNAKNYGIPQKRERVFCISILNERDTFNDTFQGFPWPEPFDNGIRLKHLLEHTVDEKFYISDEKCSKLIGQLKDDSYMMVCNTLTANYGRGISDNEIDKCRRQVVVVGNTNPSGNGMNGNVYAGDISPTLTTNKGEGLKIVLPCLTPDRLEKRQNGRRFKSDGDPMFTLTGQDRHGVALIVVEPNECIRLGNIYDEKFGTGYAGNVWGIEGISPTLMTMQGGGIQPHIPEANIAHGFRIRKLTPLECWRLMGFSDEDFNKAVGVGVSNSQLYKQAGNSIVINVLNLIFEVLFCREKLMTVSDSIN